VECFAEQETIEIETELELSKKEEAFRRKEAEIRELTERAANSEAELRELKEQLNTWCLPSHSS
jgi:seryl-tRNA synthetase